VRRTPGGSSAQRILHRERVGARHEPQVHAIEPAEPIEPPLRGADVEHAERLPVLSGRQQPGDAQAHGVERHLHLEAVADREVERLRRRRTQPHGVLGEQARALRGRGAGRREPRLQPRRTERVDADELERAVASRQPRLRLDHRAGHGDARHAASRGYSASSKPSPGACTERSAMPNRLREASCTSSAATRLIRYTENPSATPSAIATIASSVRPRRLPQRPERGGLEQRAPRAERHGRRVHAQAAVAARGRSCSPARVSS
jgi:hypothetical protein